MENKQLMYSVINRGFSDEDYNQYIEKDIDTWLKYLNGADGNTIIKEAKEKITNAVHNNMSGMMDYLFDGNHINIIVSGLTPDCTLFCGPEVAFILGYGNRADHMYEMLLPNEKILINTDTRNTNTSFNNNTNTCDMGYSQVTSSRARHTQGVMFITLPGLFRVIARSRHPKAMDFQNWVYHIVLPSIWNYGYYASASTRNMINDEPDMAVLLNKKIEELESENNMLKNQLSNKAPYINAGEFMVNNMIPLTIEELAKVLNSSGVDIGRNRLFKILTEDGFLMKTGEGNRPTQKALNMGLMTYTIKPLMDGSPYTFVHVLPKGVIYFINKYKDYGK